jgi:hypothetical protein
VKSQLENYINNSESHERFLTVAIKGKAELGAGLAVCFTVV